MPSPAEEACRSEGRAPRLPRNQLSLHWVSAHDRPSQVVEMVPSPVQEKSRSEDKAASSRLWPSALPPQARSRAAGSMGLLGAWGCWEHGAAGLSPVPALAVCLYRPPQQAPSSGIVITHANVSAPETKGGQASGRGFLSTNNIRCKMCTFDKSINIVLLIFFFLMKSEK